MMDTLAQQVQWFALAVLLGIGFGAAFCVESLVGRLLRLRRLCYAIFGGKVPCTKSSKPVMAPSLP